MKQYQLRRHDGATDPSTYSADELGEMASNGALHLKDAVRIVGKQTWHPIDSVPNLLQLISVGKNEPDPPPADQQQSSAVQLAPDTTFSDQIEPDRSAPTGPPPIRHINYEYKARTITPSVSEGDLKRGLAGKIIAKQVEGELSEMNALGFELHSQSWITVDINPGCALLGGKVTRMGRLLLVFRRQL